MLVYRFALASLALTLLTGAAAAERWQRIRGGPEGAADIALAWGRWGGEQVLFGRGDGALWRLDGRQWRRVAFAPGALLGPLADPGRDGVAWAEGARLHQRDAGARRSTTRDLPWRPRGGRAAGDSLLLWGEHGLLEARGARLTMRRVAAGPVSEAASLPSGLVRREGDRLIGGATAGPAEALAVCGDDLWIRRDEVWKGPQGRAITTAGPLACAGPGIVVAATREHLLVHGPVALGRLGRPHTVDALAATVVGDELRLAVGAHGGAVSLLHRAIPPTAPAGASAATGLRPFHAVLAAVLRNGGNSVPDLSGPLKRIRRAAWAPDLRIDGNLTTAIDEDWHWDPTSSLSTTTRSVLVGPHLLSTDGGTGRRWSTGISLHWSLDRLVWDRDELQIWRQKERNDGELERRATLAATLWSDLADPATPVADRRRAEALLLVLTGGESPWSDTP